MGAILSGICMFFFRNLFAFSGIICLFFLEFDDFDGKNYALQRDVA